MAPARTSPTQSSDSRHFRSERAAKDVFLAEYTTDLARAIDLIVARSSTAGSSCSSATAAARPTPSTSPPSSSIASCSSARRSRRSRSPPIRPRSPPSPTTTATTRSSRSRCRHWQAGRRGDRPLDQRLVAERPARRRRVSAARHDHRRPDRRQRRQARRAGRPSALRLREARVGAHPGDAHPDRPRDLRAGRAALGGAA